MKRAGLALIFLSFLAAGCGGGPARSSSAPKETAVSPAPFNVSLDPNSYAVFPDADAGADPSVPASQGGKGFTGEGWQTNTTYELVGDPRAVKGGVFRQDLADFPATLRTVGPESNTVFNDYITKRLVY